MEQLVGWTWNTFVTVMNELLTLAAASRQSMTLHVGVIGWIPPLLNVDFKFASWSLPTLSLEVFWVSQSSRSKHDHFFLKSSTTSTYEALGLFCAERTPNSSKKAASGWFSYVALQASNIATFVELLLFSAVEVGNHPLFYMNIRLTDCHGMTVKLRLDDLISYINPKTVNRTSYEIRCVSSISVPTSCR